MFKIISMFLVVAPSLVQASSSTATETELAKSCTTEASKKLLHVCLARAVEPGVLGDGAQINLL